MPDDVPEKPYDLIRDVMEAHLFCATCGYDVTGARGMCPECGQFIDENDVDTVTVGHGRPKSPEYKKTAEAATFLFRWLLLGMLLVMAIAFIIGLIGLLSTTRQIFPD